MKFHIDIMPSPSSHDCDYVYFTLNGERKGNGSKVKSTGRITVRHCPQCGRENYAIVEAEGYCAFCQYNPNE